LYLASEEDQGNYNNQDIYFKNLHLSEKSNTSQPKSETAHYGFKSAVHLKLQLNANLSNRFQKNPTTI
jgi:hypothetical protein